MNLNQVTLYVSNVPSSIPFYESLGLELIVHTHDQYARFLCDGGSTFSLEPEFDIILASQTDCK